MKTTIAISIAALVLAGTGAASAETAAAKWATECGSCHLAYPAQFLPATTWGRLMDGLNKHFGSDASLDAATTREIKDYLVANAASRWRGEDPASLRISDTRWFRRKHSEELDPAVFRTPEVKSAANCGACHMGAAQGDYSEHNIRIPGERNRYHDDDD